MDGLVPSKLQSFEVRGGWQCRPQRSQPRTLKFQPMPHTYFLGYRNTIWWKSELLNWLVILRVALSHLQGLFHCTFRIPPTLDLQLLGRFLAHQLGDLTLELGLAEAGRWERKRFLKDPIKKKIWNIVHVWARPCWDHISWRSQSSHHVGHLPSASESLHHMAQPLTSS